MTGETWLRLLLVPTAVWLASLAARRWGHTVSGYLGGMPLIGGPITLFLALDLGPAFAAQSALFTLAAVLGQAAHLLAFAHLGRRRGWVAALLGGWAAFLAVAGLAAAIAPSAEGALLMAVAGLLLAWRYLPLPQGDAPPPLIPPLELRLRLVAAFALAAMILVAAPIFGPVVSGLLLSLPITGSIMPPFTLAHYGYACVARLLRGFIVGLSGFGTFFYVVAASVEGFGVAASFVLAVGCALGAVFGVSRMSHPRA